MFDESREREREKEKERERTSTQGNNIESWREHNQCERKFRKMCRKDIRIY